MLTPLVELALELTLELCMMDRACGTALGSNHLATDSDGICRHICVKETATGRQRL